MGMHTDDGKRRSTRQRRRPLEWWRQECKVYKREHASKALHSLSLAPCQALSFSS